MHVQLGVLDQTRLDVVSARNDSEQAGLTTCNILIIAPTARQICASSEESTLKQMAEHKEEER